MFHAEQRLQLLPWRQPAKASSRLFSRQAVGRHGAPYAMPKGTGDALGPGWRDRYLGMSSYLIVSLNRCIDNH
jgi:hypothetical protein